MTGNNERFVREWWEVSYSRIGFGMPDREQAAVSRRKWFPYAKGGDFRRWAGNLDSVVNWEDDGRELQTTLTDDGCRVRATNFNLDRIFKPGIVWTVVHRARFRSGLSVQALCSLMPLVYVNRKMMIMCLLC